MRLVFAFVGFVSSVAASGVSFVATSGVCSVATSGGGLRVRILTEFFIGNNLLLKLRNFCLALKNTPKLFEKKFFSSVFILLSKFFNSVANSICLLSASSNDKYPSYISLKKE